MFLKLHLHPLPDFECALSALEAAKAVCDSAGVPPMIAWRDHVALQAWFNGAHSDDMVSDDEIAAADVWESALAAARYALRLPVHVPMDIEVVAPPSLQPLFHQHGPTRHTWRRHSNGELEEWARATLTKVHVVPPSKD